MMVIFLTGLVSMILMRTLRQDYAKYAREEDDVETLEREHGEESGWKLVHGDVFRPPRYLPVLAALLGTGVQMTMLVFFVILITIFGMLYEGRGTIITVFIVCYALTSFVGGYISGGYNARCEGKNWIKTMLLTAGLFPGTCFAIAFFAQHHRHLLPLPRRGALRHDGGHLLHVGVHLFPARALRHRHRTQLERRAG